jgi:hypothetical protein
VLSLALVALFAQAPEDPPPAPPTAPLSLRVNRAITKGVKLLRERQQADGSWGGFEGEHPGGQTALATFTLLRSGVRRSDEAVQRGLRFVLDTEFKSVYSHSVRLLLLEALNDPATWRDPADRSLDFLVQTQVEGDWAYPWGAADASNSQFALLGLRAAHRMGLSIPEETLVNAAKAIFRLQDDGGGFRYEHGRMETGGITAASLGGLTVLAEIGEGRSAVEAVLKKRAKELRAGDDWMVAHWSPSQNAYGDVGWTPSFQYPYLWAVERWCGLSRRGKLGAHDWYEEGAAWLVDRQLDNGSWLDTNESTCFALLFLRRATVTQDPSSEVLDDELDALRPPKPLTVAGDVPRLREWLALGPWRSEIPGRGLEKLPFEPAKVSPREGAKFAKRDWRRVTLKADGWVNLDEALATECDGGFVALATWIDCSESGALDAHLWLEVEDAWRVYVDGVLVGSSQRQQGAIDGSESCALKLTAGEHLLLCLVEDERGAAAFGARLSAKDGGKLERAPKFALAPSRGKGK